MVVKYTCFLCKMYDWGTNCTMDVFRLQIYNQILSFRAHASDIAQDFRQDLILPDGVNVSKITVMYVLVTMIIPMLSLIKCKLILYICINICICNCTITCSLLDMLQVVVVKRQYNTKYKHQYNCYYYRDFPLMSMLRSTHLPYRA